MGIARTFTVFLAASTVLAVIVVVGGYSYVLQNSEGCASSKNICGHVTDAGLLDATIGLRRDRELFYVKDEAQSGTSVEVSYFLPSGKASTTALSRDKQDHATRQHPTLRPNPPASTRRPSQRSAMPSPPNARRNPARPPNPPLVGPPKAAHLFAPARESELTETTLTTTRASLPV